MIRAEEQDDRRVREQQAVLLDEGRARAAVDAGVRLLHAVLDGEVAGDAPGDDQQHDDEDDEADARAPAEAAPALRLRSRNRPDRATAVAAVLVGLATWPRKRRSLRARASGAVDPIGLVRARHSGRYRSRGPGWARARGDDGGEPHGPDSRER